ncbi:MAG: glycerophosphodiester phosphodiesterase [Oscillospiraceae bacterium]|nr:glycerophosphodiester phosphodiesterase [Oscillospiraceae bacterium]
MTILTAHSGADGFPDNSLAFVRHALASGADALEIDVRRASDGSLRLGHDAADEGLPTLAEVFALLAAAPGMRVNCDLKERGLESAVCALAREHGLAGRVILTGSADPALWAASPELRETAELWLNLEEAVPGVYERRDWSLPLLLETAERALAVCRRCGLDTLNLNYRLALPPFAERLAAEGVKLSVWTVDGEADIQRFLDAGVYALTTRKLRTALRLAGR